MEELCFELPQLQSSDQDNTGETSKMPMATDIDRDGFSRKQSCLHQTQNLLGGDDRLLTIIILGMIILAKIIK